MKLLSLFDGSGGFPLAGAMCGITPVAASEVEPYPIAVTKSRFPNMKHLGDISKINGAEIEPVDIITFGSPCQDMSVAGKRAGLKHEDNGDEETTRSGLFMEAVRIIKEMRGATNGKYPRFAVWENVPGAFSSNKGEDFRLVLEELIKVAEPYAVMPEVPKKGWAYADSFSGDGWSLAYRVFDAQYWGVPQRRRRIYLVADFRGQCAGKILFEREGLRGYFAESGTQRETVAADAERSVGADDRERTNCLTPWDSQGNQVHDGTGDSVYPCLRGCGGAGYQAGYVMCDECYGIDGYNATDTRDKSSTLGVNCGMSTGGNGVVVSAGFKAGQSKAGGIGYQQECAATLSAQCSGTEPTVCIKEQRIFENHSQDTRYKGPLDVCPMLPAQLGTGGNNTPFVVENQPVICLQGNGIDRADTAGCNGKGWNDKSCYTLNTIDRPAVAYEQPIAVDRAFFNQGQNAKYEPQTYEDGTNPTLVARGPNAVCEELHASKASFFMRATTGAADTLVAIDYKDPQLVCYPTNEKAKYIVRRLTPTECARLQGFPYRWGDIDKKSDFTDEEYRFWLEVRNTHAAINGRQTKNYTEKQMLSWYNKLHTDSAEYKMWGNGIALPCALYVMQGIADAINE